jgi:hypothetical protein
MIRNHKASAVAPTTPANTPLAKTPVKRVKKAGSLPVVRGDVSSLEVTLEDIDPNSQDEGNGNGGDDQSTVKHSLHQAILMIHQAFPVLRKTAAAAASLRPSTPS